jgi:alpha-L-arabinofuranosidase
MFKDFTVSENETVVYKADFTNNQNEWEPLWGRWRVENGYYIQGDLGNRRISMLRDKLFNNCTIGFKAQKIKGDEGFLLIFSGNNKDDYYQLNIGGNGNKNVVIEKVLGGIGMVVSEQGSFQVENNRWYDIKVTIDNDEVECLIDGKPVIKYKIKEIEKRFAIAGFDQTNNEIVVKVVNAEPQEFKTSVNILGAGKISAKGQIITLAASSNKEENTFKSPLKISPKTTKYNGFTNNFNMEFKPNSLTVLRIKRE